MGIVKRVKELFTGKSEKGKPKKGTTAKTAVKKDPHLEKLSGIAKQQGDRIKLKPAPKEFGKAKSKRKKS
ncbi:MAG TPA: hypothetical protein VNH44_00155 [Micropepsaceae bacterium]|nr:hypothetical protein [Micropepsaceae bacterium]